MVLKVLGGKETVPILLNVLTRYDLIFYISLLFTIRKRRVTWNIPYCKVEKERNVNRIKGMKGCFLNGNPL